MKKNSSFFLKKVPAYNLQELLVTLVIIGILILIALPNLMPLISKTKSIEAQNQLKFISMQEKNYFYMHSTYTNDFNSLDVIVPKKVTEGGTSNYSYEVIEFSNNAFKVRATAVTDFDGDGVFNVWEINQDQQLKEIIKD